MIVGVGVGLVDVPRFEAMESRHRARLHRKVFTEGERAFASRLARGHESLAVRFAAKIAARRALRMTTGRWQDFEVSRKRGRPPVMNFHGEALREATKQGITDIALTLTHDQLCCIGLIVLERDGSAGVELS